MRFIGSVRVFKRIYASLIILMALLTIGVIGFMYFEQFDFIDALYMTIITLSTVGFGELHTFSTEGRIFTSILIVSSFGVFAYAITAISTYFASGDFAKYYKYLKVEKQIAKLNGHIIICGYGRNGYRASQELALAGIDYVVIEKDENLFNSPGRPHDVLAIHGDATKDENLLSAGIENAKALISTMPKDTDNLFIVLTARALRKDMLIISRASDDSSVKKIKQAGANNVIMPDTLGGSYMASLVVKPDVMEFWNTIVLDRENPNRIEEIACEVILKNQEISTIGDLVEKHGVNAKIIGLKDMDGSYVINPDLNLSLNAAQKIFVLGKDDEINRIKLNR